MPRSLGVPPSAWVDVRRLSSRSAPDRRHVCDALDKVGLEEVGFSVDERGLLLDTDPDHLTSTRREVLASRFRYAVFATGNDRKRAVSNGSAVRRRCARDRRLRGLRKPRLVKDHLHRESPLRRRARRLKYGCPNPGLPSGFGCYRPSSRRFSHRM